MSVRLKRGRKREKEREDISKVICMYVKKPMPLFHWKEEEEGLRTILRVCGRLLSF